ncbi:LOW QUALITY PROTEIN: hypothetical protein HID58_008730, partial [Brassica napus]
WPRTPRQLPCSIHKTIRVGTSIPFNSSNASVRLDSVYIREDEESRDHTSVFTEIIQQMQVKGVQVEELYSLDITSLDEISPVYGLWRPEEKESRVVITEPNPNFFFASQIINNACATQALLSVLMNSSIGSELSELKEFAKDFPPELKGLAISNNEAIRAAHNTFARPDSSSTTTDEDEIAARRRKRKRKMMIYLPVDGIYTSSMVLKKDPSALDNVSVSQTESSGSKWSNLWCKRGLTGISRTRFGLVSWLWLRTGKRCTGAELKEYQMKIEREDLQQYAEKSSYEALDKSLSEVNVGIETVSQKIVMEEERAKNWKKENLRRKHNYVPFLFNFLKILADKKKLKPLIEKATLIP